jgi:hypothetical protein
MLRRLAISIAVLSVALAVLRLTVLPEESTVAFLLPLLALGMMLVLAVADAVQTWGRPSRPARLSVGEIGGTPAFGVPAARTTQILGVATSWAIFGTVFPSALHQADDSSFGAVGLTVTALLPVALLILTALTFLTGPSLALRRDGVTVHTGLGGWSAPWEAFVPEPPRPPYARLPRSYDATLSLVVQRPVVRAWGLTRLRRKIGRPGMPLNLLDVHPWFLVDVIGYYVEHPERRGGIGTPEEYAHLLEALQVTAVAVPAC